MKLQLWKCFDSMGTRSHVRIFTNQKKKNKPFKKKKQNRIKKEQNQTTSLIKLIRVLFYYYYLFCFKLGKILQNVQPTPRNCR